MVKTPADLKYVSRGFYQVEEETLYVPILPAGRFYSYLDSAELSIDADKSGLPLFFQLHVPRKNWQVRDPLPVPGDPTFAAVHFISFRDTLPASSVMCDRDGSTVRITFFDDGRLTPIAVSDNLIFEITADNYLASIWISGIEDDRAARQMASWRKKIKEELGDTPPRHTRYIRIELD